jgi:acetyltransferase-like isoleucine patch superfamily enzyme
MLYKLLYSHFKQYVSAYISIYRVLKRYPSTIIGKRVDIFNQRKLELGENVSLQDNVILHCGGAEWCNFEGSITIGSQSVISSLCVFWGCGANIIIGNNFDCAPGVKIYASRTEYEKTIAFPLLNPHVFEDVIIGDNVICYTNAVISPGVKIGNGAVIGANSVVLNDVPENAIVVGSPAKVLRILVRN